MLRPQDTAWREALAGEFQAPYWSDLEAFVDAERVAYPGKIYPQEDCVFAALDRVTLDDVRVVILGQDPYHGDGQAHGLSFSVPKGVKPPPSLKNIFVELQNDVGCPVPSQGCLTAWADQGVLLLNSVLTVRAGEAFSHRKRGWETFTDGVVRILSDRAEPIVFVLWGAAAIKKGALVNTPHTKLESSHPSPLSARRGFFGSRPFSRTNLALQQFGRAPIQWCIA